jgi:hypothetical protein
MAPSHPLANSDRSRAGEKASAAEAAAWLIDPDKPEHHVMTYAEYLAAQPPWTGPIAGDDDYREDQ